MNKMIDVTEEVLVQVFSLQDAEAILKSFDQKGAFNKLGLISDVNTLKDIVPFP